MKPEFEECDSCGNVIEELPRRRSPMTQSLALQNDEGTWEVHTFVLCHECRRKIVDWVEGCDESETRVDLQLVNDVVKGLRDQARLLEETAEELEQYDGN